MQKNLWWIKRVALLPVYLFVFAIVVFFLVRLIPGDPVLNAAGGQPQTPEQYAATQAALGLDGSLWDQLVAYLGRLVTFDLGVSFSTGADVLADLLRVVPGTVEIALLSSAGIVVLAALIGTSVIHRPDGIVARVGSWVARTAGAVPDFVIGIFGIVLFFIVLAVAPAPIGRYDVMLTPPATVTGFPLLDALLLGRPDLFASMLAHLWLPCLTLVLAYGPMLLKVLLPSIHATAAAPSTLFQVATGWRPWDVSVSVWRRAAPPAIAACGTIFGYLLGGAVVIEQLFALQGSAAYAVNAVKRSDYVGLQGILLAIGLISLVVFLIVDIVTATVDPRRRVDVVA